MQAGGNVGLRVPRAVIAGLGDVILVDTQGRFFAGISANAVVMRLRAMIAAMSMANTRWIFFIWFSPS